MEPASDGEDGTLSQLIAAAAADENALHGVPPPHAHAHAHALASAHVSRAYQQPGGEGGSLSQGSSVEIEGDVPPGATAGSDSQMSDASCIGLLAEATGWAAPTYGAPAAGVLVSAAEADEEVYLSGGASSQHGANSEHASQSPEVSQ
jgi:hypothetical protein